MNTKQTIIFFVAILFLILVAVAMPAQATPSNAADRAALADSLSVYNLKSPLKAEWFPKKENVDDKGIVVFRIKL